MSWVWLEVSTTHVFLMLSSIERWGGTGNNTKFIFYRLVFFLFKGEGDISRWRHLKLCIARLSLGEARLAEDTSDDHLEEPLLDYNKIVWCLAHELELPCILLACSLVFPTYNSGIIRHRHGMPKNLRATRIQCIFLQLKNHLTF